MRKFVNQLVLGVLIFAITPSFALAQRIVFDTAQHQFVAPMIEGLAETYTNIGFSENPIAGLNQGALDVAALPLGTITKLAPHLEFLGDPFVVLDQKHIAKLRGDSELMDEMSKPLAPFDLKIIGILYLGQWGVMSNVEHFVGMDIKPEMVKQLRLGVKRDVMDMQSARGLGMVPIPMPDNQFHSALKMSAVDAIAQSSLVAAGDACLQWVPFLHKTSINFLVVKSSRWTALSMEARDAEVTTVSALAGDMEQAILDQERAVIQANTEQGCDVIKADVAAFKSVVRRAPPNPDLPVTWADGLYQKVISIGG